MEGGKALALLVAGVCVYWLVYLAAKRSGVGVKTPSAPQAHRRDHAPGNAIPMKTVQPFKKVSDYMFSPWDPTNNAEKVSFLDAENMPRTDYILPGGGRLVTHGFSHHARTSQPGFPVHNAYDGGSLGAERPIQATTIKKNLNHHTSIWHGNH